MTYTELINKLRVELKDFPRLQRDRFDGDATTTLFETSKIPIQDSTYVVKVGGVAQTEVTDYALDKDTGVLEFVSAPASGSDNVEITYKSVIIRSEDYLELINDGIDFFRWMFWNKEIDEDTITTTKDAYTIDLSVLDDEVLYITKVQYKVSSGSTQWNEVQGITNYRYDTKLNVLLVNPTFDTSSLPMRFTFLKSFAKGSTGSATIDIPTKWLLPYKYYVYARYYERLISEKIHETAAVTTQPTYAPAQVVFDIAEKFYRKSRESAKMLAPKLPPMPFKQIHSGVII